MAKSSFERTQRRRSAQPLGDQKRDAQLKTWLGYTKIVRATCSQKVTSSKPILQRAAIFVRAAVDQRNSKVAVTADMQDVVFKAK